MRTATGGIASVMNSRAAAPPKTVKIGAPRTAAVRITSKPGQAGTPSNTSKNWPSHRPTMMPVPATARPAQPGAARHTTRAAIRPNEMGRTSCATQTGTPAAMIVPASLSRRTSSTPPRARMVDTAAATVAAKIWALRRAGPSGMKVAVARAMSLPRRAAIAAPRKPTHSVRCWTKGIDPGMPPAKTRRTRISARGSSTMAASAQVARNSSAEPKTRPAHEPARVARSARSTQAPLSANWLICSA